MLTMLDVIVIYLVHYNLSINVLITFQNIGGGNANTT